MQADVDDGAGEQPGAGVLLRQRFVRREKADLVHQIGRVAGPALGHRAAEEHADAARAVDRGDTADFVMRRVRVVVLHVVADRAVMNDVIQLDDAVFVARSRRACSSAGISASIGVTT